MILNLVLIGLFTGAITGITGASGVLIIVPILATLTDLPLHVILGTSLLVDVIASASVSFTYWRNKHVDLKRALWLLVGSLFGAQVGSFFAVSFSKLFILFAIAAGMLFFGFSMWRSGVTKKPPRFITLAEHHASYLHSPFAMVILGLLIGLSTGIFGAGGGLAIFIILYSFMRLPIKTAVGTSTFVMLLTALSGVIGYVEYSNLDLKNGLIIGVAAALGGALSAVFANRINDEILAKLIGAFFIFLALVMLFLKVIAPILS
ncbi:hypothetical protein A2645_02205 [Candidatus Nomurabacteria bacterium RIFCSPHIGHO2_01_FULL_39_9]|uniref:Probable membrane transporter protein n=1 Tax=Candidatus Nomurabacteria bacterium RIFCSPHIGHO2_01_FULL_39_9 TaxID=1801735 RepID=A0A1F6UUX4_9BACT|nr:MAG: hypothetical protein A2645_02205 [Candidatus Nomurabacteria bacterium RIFCSPHIGHO2_01_FULL_39_9]